MLSSLKTLKRGPPGASLLHWLSALLCLVSAAANLYLYLRAAPMPGSLLALQLAALLGIGWQLRQAARSIAMLEDGTPLVTRKALGQGQVVLFHVTANAEWSSLPLSGLFVQMLERLAVSTKAARPEAEDLAGQTGKTRQVLEILLHSGF